MNVSFGQWTKWKMSLLVLLETTLDQIDNRRDIINKYKRYYGTGYGRE